MNQQAHTLICALNWIGDSIMAMPAVQGYANTHPERMITVLAKRSVAELWRMCPAVDHVELFEGGLVGVQRAAHRVRLAAPETAYIMPHSFRSSLPPYLARVPKRIGMPGHFRDWMLTDIVHPPVQPDRYHQAYEYLELFGLQAAKLEGMAPELNIPEAAEASMKNRLPDPAAPCIAIIPGAARGPSKQWPAERFIELGRLFGGDAYRVLVLGAPSEKDLCGHVADAIGSCAKNFAGDTGFAEWVATLKHAKLVVANDSGGMHVAAAVNTPVVALFGITDPAKTGPMGGSHRILKSGETARRDVGRNESDARASLAAISADEVYRAANELLEKV